MYVIPESDTLTDAAMMESSIVSVNGMNSYVKVHQAPKVSVKGPQLGDQ